jgi:hypothetical protein
MKTSAIMAFSVGAAFLALASLSPLWLLPSAGWMMLAAACQQFAPPDDDDETTC